MSGWTILTVRGKEAKDYEYSRDDNTDPWDATADIVATMADDRRVRAWTTWSGSGHVYAYLNSESYDFEFAEGLLQDYSEMVRDAVVLGANNTTDQGMARYYPDPESARWTDSYEEIEEGMVGEQALAVMTSRHGIAARDPFHNECGQLDESYESNGQKRDVDPKGQA